MDRADEPSSEVGEAPAQVFERSLSITSETVSGVGEGDETKDLRGDETAAVEIQRMYKGYQTRRTIADAATMAQKYGWWNVVEGLRLQHYSQDFYTYNTQQNAAQRWLRLKKKAARVGKGLSKNEKARKLVLQHWLEAIDPKHRYGHNLQFYYQKWEKCETQEPFFYWLDVGGGKDLELEKCSRSKLQKELISYLGPKERKRFEVIIEDGQLIEKLTRQPVDTPNGEKWIFVMGTTGKLYVGKKEKGKLQHSSFLAGGATTAAGRLLVRNGKIELMEAHSGHYHPTSENFHQLINVLTRNGADLTNAQVNFVSDDMLSSTSRKSVGVLEESGDASQLDNSAGCDPTETNISESGKQDLSVREVEVCSFRNEDNVSSVEHVHLLEATAGPQHSQSVSELDVDEHQVFPRGSEAGSPRKKDFEAVRLDMIRPKEACELWQEDIRFQADDDFGHGEKYASRRPELQRQNSQHRLFGPALRTFSNLGDRRSKYLQTPDLGDMTSRANVDLSPDTKASLLRHLSLRRVVAAPS